MEIERRARLKRAYEEWEYFNRVERRDVRRIILSEFIFAPNLAFGDLFIRFMKRIIKILRFIEGQ